MKRGRAATRYRRDALRFKRREHTWQQKLKLCTGTGRKSQIRTGSMKDCKHCPFIRNVPDTGGEFGVAVASQPITTDEAQQAWDRFMAELTGDMAELTGERK